MSFESSLEQSSWWTGGAQWGGGRKKTWGSKEQQGEDLTDMDCKVVGSPELKSRISNLIWNSTKSPGRCGGMGVLWWNEGLLVMMWTAEFWTSWSLWGGFARELKEKRIYRGKKSCVYARKKWERNGQRKTNKEIWREEQQAVSSKACSPYTQGRTNQRRKQQWMINTERC